VTFVKMHVDEIEIDERLVQKLVAKQFPAWSALPLERIELGGTVNVIYRLGEEMAIRLPRRQYDPERLETERHWLPRLAPHLPLAIPLPLARGRPGEDYPFGWSIDSWLDGETATLEQLTDPAQTAVDLAGFIAALQTIETAGGPAPGPGNGWRGAPLELRDPGMREAIGALRDQRDAETVTALWEHALGASPWPGAPVWLHGDLDSRNLLARDGRLWAAIDFGCLGVGDPACDVMVAWKLLPLAQRSTFREALSVDDATWTRARGWVLWQALTALAYYTLETNAVLVLEARRWLAEVLAET
jgi:aminoglycoside phosphotransferase (APT) family kinase protein